MAPLTVDFEDLSTEDPTSWAWDFGDGEASSDQNPSHTYQTEGIYSVSLTATNADGSDTMMMTDYISVPEPTTSTQLIAGVVGLLALSLHRRRR